MEITSNIIKGKRIGIIGYGTIGKKIKSLFEGNNTILVCDINDGDGIDYTSYTDPGLRDVDFAYIATPPNTHLSISKYFLGNRINVITEKPPIHTAQDLESLTRLINTYGQRFYCGYHAVFNHLIIQAVDKFTKQPVSNASVIFSEEVSDYHPDSDNWVFKPHISGGGCVIDSGINIFSILDQFYDSLTVHKATLEYSIHEVESSARIILQSGQNKIIVTQDWHSEKENRELDFGDFAINLANNSMYHRSIDIPKNQYPKDEYQAMVEDAVEYFQSGSSRVKDFLKPIQLVFDVYRMAKKH